MKTFSKYIYNIFILFFCSVNGSEINDFKIFYNNQPHINYIENLLITQKVDIYNPKEPNNINLSASKNLLTKEAGIDDFEEFVRLVTMGDIDEKQIKKQAANLFTIYKKNINNNDAEKYYTDVTEKHFDFFRSNYYWESDWKFDPEDAEYEISELIGVNFKFVHPSLKNYSKELFPNIQSALAKLGMTLMTCDTKGDFYIFFVVNISDVDRVLELSEITKIEINQL